MTLKLKEGTKKEDWSRKNIAFYMDLGMLNNLVGYAVKQSPSITRKSLTNLRTYFSILDKTIYENDDRLMTRIKFIERALEARLDLYMENRSLIVDHATTRADENAAIVRNLPRYEKVSFDEIRGINKMVQDRIQYYFVVTYKDKLYNAVERLDSGDFDSYQSISEEIETLSKDLINMMRKAKIVSSKSNFSLGEGFNAGVMDIVKTLRNPARILKTGIQALNEILVDGYHSKRLYTYMGLPGGYKSWILLKSAYDIKKYNVGVPAKKEGARKTVLFITMENDVEETVERLFNMTVTGDDIREFEPEQVVKMLREKGELTLTDETEIDIMIQYYPDHSISTDDIYTIMDDLEDENREIIAFVIDYVKRIRSATPTLDEKTELKNVTNELKTIATEKDIPVITAHQLNRNAASVVDSALQDNKEDVTRQIGRSNVGTAWEVMENSDWACIINIEKRRDTGQAYLTFKRVKIRYKFKSDLTYFNHPFAEDNGVKLVDDIHLDESLSELTLATDLDGAEIKTRKGSRTAAEREVISDEEAAKFLDFEIVRSEHQVKAGSAA